eukprot:scaffold7079_cov128-Isochrysis_galbana.AAC.7
MQHSIGHRIEIDYGPTCAQRPHARPLEYVGHACMHVHVQHIVATKAPHNSVHAESTPSTTLRVLHTGGRGLAGDPLYPITHAQLPSAL